jgi:uncharacterized protein
MANPVVHFEIMGKDASALRSFYHDAFEWDIAPPIPGSPVDYSLIPRDESSGGIGGGIGQQEGYDGHVTVYIGVPDVAAALRTVETHGGKTLMGPDQVPNGPVIGLFRDPEQRVVGVVQIPAKG